MSRLPDLEAWAIFAKVAEHSSFTGAAEDLGLSKATVSKLVSRLEHHIGAALLHRTSRQLSLTETGRDVAVKAARLLADFGEMEAGAMSRSPEPQGRIRMSAPMSFGLAHLAPILPDLFLAYPKIEIDLHLGDEVVDLVRGGFDLALRIAALPDSSLRTRRLCGIRRMLVAAPAYFERREPPRHPSDLEHHVCLGYTNFPVPDRWRFFHGSGGDVTVVPRGPMRANNGDAMMAVLRAGLGLAVQPEFMIHEDLAAGRLVEAMADWSMAPIALNIVSPPGGPRPARVVVVAEFLARRLAQASWVTARQPPDQDVLRS